MYCSASLFLKEWTLRSFGMNTSVDKDVRQTVHNVGYLLPISKILILPFPERIEKVQIILSHLAKRDTLCLRRYDSYDIRLLILCAM